MSKFIELNTPDSLVQALTRMNITEPTPIQTMAIPPALEGKDLLASAQTGTGKTIAFLIPLITKLIENPTMTSLIVAPTRELAMQVRDAAILLVNRSSIYTALLIGGDPMPKQFMQLRRKPRIIVGTPGRITDHLYRQTLSLENTGFVVIDEMDRMLDIGLREQLDDICKHLPATCQKLMFSATMPDHIIALSKQYLKDPVRISAGSTTQAAPKIEQIFINTTTADIFSCLVKELDTRPGSAIIFVRTKRGAAQLAEKLNRTIVTDNNLPIADAIHGDLRQNRREKVIQLFRNSKIRVLVATDIAARGLDIPHVKVVFNWELPENAEDYPHRIGRTGRAGAVGVACSFIRKGVDERKQREIDRFMNPGNYSGPAEPSSRRGGGRSSSRSNSRPYGAGNSTRARQSNSFGSSWSSEGTAPRSGGERSFERSERSPRTERSSEKSNNFDRGSRPPRAHSFERDPLPRSNSEQRRERPSHNRMSESGSSENRSRNWSSNRDSQSSFSGGRREDYSRPERSNATEGGSNRFNNDRRSNFGDNRVFSHSEGRSSTSSYGRKPNTSSNAHNSFGRSKFKKERTSDSF